MIKNRSPVGTVFIRLTSVLLLCLSAAALLPSMADAFAPTDSQRREAESAYQLIQTETRTTSRAFDDRPGLHEELFGIGKCAGEVLKDVPGYRKEDADPALKPYWNQARKAMSMAVLVSLGTAASAVDGTSLSGESRLRALAEATRWKPARDALIKQANAVRIWLISGTKTVDICGLLQAWKDQGYLGFGTLTAAAWGPDVLGNLTRRSYRLTLHSRQLRKLQITLDGPGAVPIAERRATFLQGPRLFSRADNAFSRGWDVGFSDS